MEHPLTGSMFLWSTPKPPDVTQNSTQFCIKTANIILENQLISFLPHFCEVLCCFTEEATDTFCHTCGMQTAGNHFLNMISSFPVTLKLHLLLFQYMKSSCVSSEAAVEWFWTCYSSAALCIPNLIDRP